MKTVILMAYICSSPAMDNCTVWNEGEWAGAAAAVYCTVERDLAEASVLPGQFIRYECVATSENHELAMD